MSTHLSATVNTSGSPSTYLSMDLPMLLDIQSWHDYSAFQLLNSTAQCELIDMSHCHESCTSRFLQLRGWLGEGQLVLQCLQGPLKPRKPD
jgi:hypothetical protein